MKKITEGYINLVKSKMNILSEDTTILSGERKKICDKCKFRDTILNVCTKCGCYLPAKQKSETATCPKGYW